MEMFYTLIEDLQRTVEGIDISTQALALSGLAAGIMLLFLALASLARKPTAVVRMQAGAQRMQQSARRDGDGALTRHVSEWRLDAQANPATGRRR